MYFKLLELFFESPTKRIKAKEGNNCVFDIIKLCEQAKVSILTKNHKHKLARQ